MLLGGQVHGKETGQQGAHADLKTTYFSSGNSLKYPCILGFGVHTSTTPRPGWLGGMPGARGYTPNLASTKLCKFFHTLFPKNLFLYLLKIHLVYKSLLCF